MDILDLDNRNEFFDTADDVIIVPNIEDIRIKDPEVYMRRLETIQSPRERLLEFLKSQFDLSYEPTHEAVYIRIMGLTGLMFGWLLGGMARTRHTFEDLRRQHNASVFDGHHRAKRYIMDNYVYTSIRKGARVGLGSCLLCSSAGLIGFGTIIYRDRLYLPDWLVGFGTLGAVSRCWLGTRGVVFGAGMGVLAGAFGYGYARFMEISTGKSIAEMRYMTHVEYARKRQIQLDRYHKARQETDLEMLSKVS
jgi:hypothetical protein